jgi:transposase
LSTLELTCQARGFRVLFLPKFHCELNFIEQCWGCAKREYRKYPPSTKESDLERNVVMALDSETLESMRKYIVF